MTDDTDKLATQMKNLRPSKTSRERGISAAMAAFNQEFAAETTAENLSAKIEASEKLDKNSLTSQGLADGPRPTGNPTKTVRVKTRRVETMAKLKNVFNFKPQTMMMAGTCSAALIAAMIVLPNMDEMSETMPPASTKSVSVDQDVKEPSASLEPSPKVVDRDVAKKPQASANVIVDEIVVTSRQPSGVETAQNKAPAKSSVPLSDIKNARPEFEPPAQSIVAAPPPPGNPLPKSTRQGGMADVYERLDADKQLNEIRQDSQRAESENKNRVRKFKTPVSPSVSITPPPPQIERQSASSPRARGRAPALASSAAQPIAPSYDKSAPPPSKGPEKIAGLTLEQSAPVFKTVTETIVTQEASTELVTVPATYETVTEEVVVREASTEVIVMPAEYEWVEGDVEGSVVEYEVKPAEYETVTEPVIVQEASTELVTIPPTYETVMETRVTQPSYAAADGSIVPAVTEQVERRVIKTPASTQERVVPAVTKMETRRVMKTPASAIERIVPYEKKNGKTRVPVKAATVIEKDVPAVTKEVTRRVIKTPARTTERVIPSVPRTIERQVLVTPPKFYLRDDDGNIVREFESRDAFEIYKANLPTPVTETPVSTFSVDVDTSSYSFLRASINRGQLPPRSSIRLEEMINYFPYDYEAPTSADEPFKANVSVTPNPWNVDTKLMHIGIKGYVPKQTEKPRSNLVFLIDTSGSMRSANKLPLLVNSFKLLLNTLDEDDTVSIVAYASASGTVLEPTQVKNKAEIINALNNLRSGGSTAGAAGLELAYQKAQESFDDEGVNRVILATDGDFNVGFSSPGDMKAFIQKKRKTGIFLSVLGFGMGNYNDHLMQSLAQNGNGVAAYIDNLAEANKVLANEAGSALFTIAKDVKIQVEFNPAQVAEYRLIGYETRALKRQDFNNDKVDAGEIGAGHSVTAIYEMTPVGSPAVSVDKLRYASETPKTNTGSDEYAFVKIRHKLPDAEKSRLQTFPIGKRQERSLRRASDDMRFAAAVAAVGQKLRGDTAVEDYSYEDALQLAKSAKGKDENGYRAEFIQLVQLIESLEE